MNYGHRAKLEQLGLSPSEAQVYLAVLGDGPLAAAAIANETGITRTNVYPTLCSLADKGLVEGGAGYGSKFAAVPPDQALPSLIAREKQSVSERERIANELAESLAPLAVDAASALDGTVQVVRTPRVISDRLHRLQLEAQHHVELIVKAPILNPRRGNPAQRKARQRGVRYRCLYEQAVLEDTEIKPYLETWIAEGEEARVYDGELPYKLAVFDSQVVLLTLVRRGGQSSALLVRHAPFAKSISILFDSFWREADPLVLDGAYKRRTAYPRKSRLNLRGSAVGASDSESQNSDPNRV